MKRKKYRVKKKPPKGICRMWGCQEHTRAQGLCENHYNYFRKTDRLEMYGAEKIGCSLSPEEARKRLASFRKKKNPEMGMCFIIELGKGCKKAVAKSGMCRAHYAVLWRKGLQRKFKI